MAVIKRVVGQITLSRIVDVVSTTYFYLLMPSIAAAPNKPTVSPPPIYETEGYSGWSETEPAYISGDTRSLYVTVRTIYGDGSFEYTTPSLSSSYEAAKQAYNRAQSAMNLVGDMNQYFWEIPQAYSTNVPAGAYITEIAQSLFKPNPSGGNIVVQSSGITIRDGATQLSSLTGLGLNFYDPNPAQGNNNLILSINNGGTLQSGNYLRGNDTKFASSGTKIDLTNGEIYTPYFRLAQGLDGVTAGAYVHGTIEALDGRIGTGYKPIGEPETNYWEIGNYTDYNLENTAKIIGHGSSFIQLGDDGTWRLATNRIHTGWHQSGDTFLHFPNFTIDGSSDNSKRRFWDYGMHTPTAYNDKFIYIRTAAYDTSLSNLLYDIDDSFTQHYWSYKFWIDGEGNIHAKNFYAGNTLIGGEDSAAGSLLSYGGSATQPVYFPSSGTNQGKPTPINYTIGQSIPSDSIWIKSVSTTGSGNAVTDVSFNSTTGAITATKGATYLIASDIANKADKATTLAGYGITDALSSSLKGANGGLAELDNGGKVPSSQLPSYVDDVIEYTTVNNFPATGESGKIYIDTTTNITYRWSGSIYVEIASSLALGETSSTAYRGDRGKIAYDHAAAKGSAFASGLYKITTNSEGHITAATAASKSDIGLGNVENKSSATIRGELTSNNVTSALGFTPFSGIAVTNLSVDVDSTDNKTYLYVTKSNSDTPQKLSLADISIVQAEGATTLVDTNGIGLNVSGPVKFVGGKPESMTGTGNDTIPWSLISGTPNTYPVELAKYNILGGVKPLYSWTNAISETSTASITSTAPTINTRQTTSGRYYAVEIDKNGRLFVNVPWENSTDLSGAVTKITTVAGSHSVITNATGNVSFNVPTNTSHLTNDSHFTAVQIVRW